LITPSTSRCFAVASVGYLNFFFPYIFHHPFPVPSGISDGLPLQTLQRDQAIVLLACWVVNIPASANRLSSMKFWAIDIVTESSIVVFDSGGLASELLVSQFLKPTHISLASSPRLLAGHHSFVGLESISQARRDSPPARLSPDLAQLDIHRLHLCHRFSNLALAYCPGENLKSTWTIPGAPAHNIPSWDSSRPICCLSRHDHSRHLRNPHYERFALTFSMSQLDSLASGPRRSTGSTTLGTHYRLFSGPPCSPYFSAVSHPSCWTPSKPLCIWPTLATSSSSFLDSSALPDPYTPRPYHVPSIFRGRRGIGPFRCLCSLLRLLGSAASSSP